MSPNNLSIATSPMVFLNNNSSSPRLDIFCTAGRTNNNLPNRPLGVQGRFKQYSFNITWVWSWSNSIWAGSQIPRDSKKIYLKHQWNNTEKYLIPALNKTRAFRQAYSVWSILSKVNLVMTSRSFLAFSSKVNCLDDVLIALLIKESIKIKSFIKWKKNESYFFTLIYR